MRLSGNCCVICGRHTHIAGDELCMDLAIYFMRDERLKKKERKQVERSMSRHRISIAPASLTAKPPSTAPEETRKAHKMLNVAALLPRLTEDDEDDTADGSSDNRSRLGAQLVSKHWKEAEKAGLHCPRRPSVCCALFWVPWMYVGLTLLSIVSLLCTRDGQTTPLVISSRLSLLPSSITRSTHVSQRKLSSKSKLSIDEQIRHIRESWPYEWSESEMDTGDSEVMESEREALVTKRCMTFSRARSPSKSDLDTGSGRSRSRSRSPSRTASISARGNLTVR